MRPDEVRAVMRTHRDIHGWFSKDAALLFGLLDEVQRSAGVAGDLFEIGAHHGKSAVLLWKMARESEQIGVCDLFGDQQTNVSLSGQGDRDVLEQNLAKAGADFSRISVFAKSSADLSPDEIGESKRFFHVDGGHLREEALTDLQLGAAVLHERGAIAVDDPFRAEWPGVTEAIIRFCQERSDYSPVAVGFNKLVLVPREARPDYEVALSPDGLCWDYFDRGVFETKILPIADDPVRIFYIPSYRQIAGLEPTVASLRSRFSTAKRRFRSLAR